MVHRVTTQAPSVVWLALPKGARQPARGYQKIKAGYLSGASCSERVERHQRCEGDVRVYSVAKTVVDCFKFRNRIGLDVVLEALREGWRERQEDFQLLLVRFALERPLYRLSVSEYADQFILKGALLFQLWFDMPQRPTRDADFPGFGEAEPRRLVEICRVLTELATPESTEDGVDYLPESVCAEPIREADGYPGVRVGLTAQLAGARIPAQCDIGFGDVVAPAAERAAFSALLRLPASMRRETRTVAYELDVITDGQMPLSLNPPREYSATRGPLP